MIVKTLLLLGIITFVVDYGAYLIDFHQSPVLVNLVIEGVVLFIIFRGVMNFLRSRTRSRYR